ncbi:nucleotide exchange factor GrpE [Sporosarcina sp. Te-1]|uniref:nucleotide exchange factor GrpE n=1 Tax=Sporosarcina sp. Te-1 TaxID=2818390 RepID=UPI001A9F3A5A|nr:nucleotide exchange factor GrpE [Sporosarcina sp. Te-1]QTD41652.1 nucleotide exchange factor GrpE [Sporosarcina sp. Te-1]
MNEEKKEEVLADELAGTVLENEEAHEQADLDAEALEGESQNEEANKSDAIIEELKSKLQEEENKQLRLMADFENFKRRSNLDKESLQKYRAQSLMTNLLPVLDNFERALNLEAKTEEAQSLMTGMDMIYRNLLDALKTEGLVEIEAADQEFDPNFHQAVMTGIDEEKASGIVLEELQKGYKLKDRVLRPTMVKVNE